MLLTCLVLVLLFFLVLMFSFCLLRKEKETLETEASLIDKKVSFKDTSIYMSIDTNSMAVIPSTQCCSFTFNIIQSKLPDNSYLVSSNTQQFLRLVYIDLKGPASYYSVQVVPFEKVQNGWFVEEQGSNTFRIYQLFDKKHIYLGLSYNKKTIQGVALDSLYSTIDLVLS